MTAGRLSQWITFFKGILDSSIGDQYETATEDPEQIENLERTPLWKLKGVVS